MNTLALTVQQERALADGIYNPNTCGQGYHPAHSANPYYDMLMAFGYSYSHTTPVSVETPDREHTLRYVRVMHHTYKRAGHGVSVYTLPSIGWQPTHWETSTPNSPGLRQSRGRDATALRKALQGKAKRYPELRNY
jgi:hypothetical protein